MPQVRAKVLCFIDNSLRREGDVFEYNGPENSNVEYLDGSAPEPVSSHTEVAAPAPKRRRLFNKEASTAAD